MDANVICESDKNALKTLYILPGASYGFVKSSGWKESSDVSRGYLAFIGCFLYGGVCSRFHGVPALSQCLVLAGK